MVRIFFLSLDIVEFVLIRTAAKFLKCNTLNRLMSLATLNDMDLQGLVMASLWNRANTLFEDLIRYVMVFDRPGRFSRPSSRSDSG